MEKKIDRRGSKSKPSPKAPAQPTNGAEENEDDDDEEEDEEDIPVSDLEDLDDADKEDLIPHSRLTIYNSTALDAALKRIALPTDKKTPFATHQSLLSSAETAASIPDVSDDLQRELAFYSQGLEAARQGRTRLRAEGVAFSRPKDYFAEMVKEDAHMEKIKAKLVEEASNKKAAAEARKLRDLKKFGKKVQVAKLQERQKEKRETLDKIKNLKRSKSQPLPHTSVNPHDPAR
jgi:rRNA-processing protein EBP2